MQDKNWMILLKDNLPWRNDDSARILSTTEELLVLAFIARNEDQQSLALATSGICELVAIQPITSSAYLHSFTILVVTGQWYAHLVGEYGTCGKI